MRKLRIAIVCDSILDVTSGAMLSGLRFAELLSAKGHNVVLISSAFADRTATTHKGMQLYRLPSFPAPGSKNRMYCAYPQISKVKEILKKERIELVHLITPTPLTWAALKAAKALKLKIVSHSHAQPADLTSYLPNNWKPLESRIITLGYHYLIWYYNQADAVVCPTAFSETILKEHKLKTKTYVISNGVDIKQFKKKSGQKVMRKYHLSAKKKRLLFVGRLDPNKNLPVLIKAASQFPAAEVCIAGSGVHQDGLRALAAKTKNVRFLGHVPDEDLVGLYNAADIFVLPSLQELEGIVAMEAMACGKPLLIADAPDSAAVAFIDGNGFLFEPNIPEDLAKKALRMLKDNALRKRMAAKSYRKSRNFDINKSVVALEHLYASLTK